MPDSHAPAAEAVAHESSRCARLGSLLSVVLILCSVPVDGQDVTESARIIGPVNDAHAHLGSTVALGRFNGLSKTVAGAPAALVGAPRLQEDFVSVLVYEQVDGLWSRRSTFSYIGGGYTVPVGAGGDLLATVSLDSFQPGGSVLRTLYPWTQNTVSILTDPPMAVAVHPDVMAVGFPTYNESRGRVDVLMEVQSSWVVLSSIYGTDPGDLLGTSVAVDETGTLLAVGAPGNGLGEVEIWNWDAGNLSYDHTLEHPTFLQSQSAARFGWSVSLGAGRVAVGAPDADVSVVIPPADPIIDTGYAFVYRRQAGEFVFEKLYHGTSGDDGFGTSVAIADAGSGSALLAVGVPGADRSGVGNDAGLVRTYAYSASSSSWTPHWTLVDSAAAQGDALGMAVATDGSAVLAGAPFADASPQRGISVIHVGAGLVWDKVAPLLFADGFESGDVSAWQ